MVYPVRIYPDRQWTLTFSDDFSGSSIDASKWNTPAYNPGNGELEWYQSANVTVANNLCSLNAKAQTTVQGGTTYNYTSGLINTNGLFSQAYGYFEARIKIPAGKGLWPAFWMLPQDNSWPPELDIMEIIGGSPNTVYFTDHYGTSGSPQQHSASVTGVDFSADFHDYAMYWTPTSINWYIDGMLQYQVTSDIPSKAMYLILNLAVGGSFPGSPDGTTPFPAVCQVDYVRAWTVVDK